MHTTPLSHIKVGFTYTPPESRISASIAFQTVVERRFSFLQGSSAIRATSNMSTNGGDAEKRMVHFNLSPTRVLKIQKGDITRWFIDGSSDAIVNPTDEGMLGGGGADAAIHGAAGPELRTACYGAGEVRPGIRCPTGAARMTPGFKLPAYRVIHTVGPVYNEDENPAATLRNAYRNCLRYVRGNSLKHVAFPAISCGANGYPFEEAATVAISTIRDYFHSVKEIHFVLYSDDIYDVWVKKAEELLKN